MKTKKQRWHMKPMSAWVPQLRITQKNNGILREILDNPGFVASVCSVAENYAAMVEMWKSVPSRAEERAYLAELQDAQRQLLNLMKAMPERVRAELWRFFNSGEEKELERLLLSMRGHLDVAKDKLPKPAAGRPPDVAKRSAARELSIVFSRFGLPWHAGQLRDDYEADSVDGTHPAIDALWVVFETARGVTDSIQISRKAAADYVRATEPK